MPPLSTIARLLPIGQRILSAGNTAGRAFGQAAGTALRATGQAARGLNASLRSSTGTLPGQTTAGGLARFAAGVPSDQRFFSGVGGSLKNTAKMLSRPNYPGLDRIPGVAGPLPPNALAGKNIGGWLRNASTAATGGTLAVGAYDTAVNYPRGIAAGLVLNNGGRKMIGEGDRSAIDRIDELTPHVRGLAPTLLKGLAGGGDQSPAGRIVHDVVRETAIPDLRYNLHRSRQTDPGLFGTLDAMRSLTPIGALTTLGIRTLGSKTPPDTTGAIRRAVQRHAPDAIKQPAAVEASPYYQLWKNHVVSPDILKRHTLQQHTRPLAQAAAKHLDQASLAGDMYASAGLSAATPYLRQLPRQQENMIRQNVWQAARTPRDLRDQLLHNTQVVDDAGAAAADAVYRRGLSAYANENPAWYAALQQLAAQAPR